MLQVVGHRGVAGLMPENTLKGFEHAIALGVDAVECDVHLTRDGKLVVIHDAQVERTTDGSGDVGSMDFDAVRKLDAGDGEQVPTLCEVLDTVRGRIELNCELKGEGVEQAAVETIESRGMGNDVVFTCFQLERLARVRALDPALRIGVIFSNPSDEDIAQALEFGVMSLEVNYRHLCLRMVERVLAAGVVLRAWNPDTVPEQQAMIALGATSICCNRPDILLKHLGRL